MQKLTVLLSLLSISMLTQAEVRTFKPSMSQFSHSAQQRKQQNQLYALGEVSFNNNVRVPYYGVTVLDPIADNLRLRKDVQPCSAASCHFKFSLAAEQAQQLKLLNIPEVGLVLVPKNWQDIEADVGANGTGRALLMNPQQQYAIEMSDSSLCVGCGMPEASLYFPELLKKSIAYEFGGYHDPKHYLKLVHPSKYVAFFSYDVPKAKLTTHGIAKYTPEDQFNFRIIHVTLAPTDKHLVSSILNFYNFTH